MTVNFSDYTIHIVTSSNFKNKFVAYLEELHNVSELIDNKEEADLVLKPKFEKEIERLRRTSQPIPKPNSGKVRISFAPKGKIEHLSPFIDEFWEKILGTSYSSSFVSDDSHFSSWERYLKDGKKELIEKVKQEFNVDIGNVYDQPVYKILEIIKNSRGT